jgi:hypothetical protein
MWSRTTTNKCTCASVVMFGGCFNGKNVGNESFEIYEWLNWNDKSFEKWVHSDLASGFFNFKASKLSETRPCFRKKQAST